ncbi:MAG: tetratricopeptide repeat protein [Brevinema sp.]
MKNLLFIILIFSGISLQAQEKTALSETELRRTLKQDPQNINAYVDLIKIATSREAVSKLETEAFNNIGARSSIYNEIGNTYMKLQDFHSAVPAYQQALALNSLSATTYNRLGLALLKISYFRQAEVSFKAAISLTSSPNSKILYLNNLAITLENLKLYKEAKEIIDTSLKIIPSHQPSLEIQNRLRVKMPSLFQ